MSNKLVTVITRTKNRLIFIPRVFETIIQQSYRPIEWIIVNDNGERIDDLIEKLKSEYTEHLDGIDICLINKKESIGMEAAANTGLKHAHGFYIKLLDDDDTLETSCIEKQIKYMEEEKLPNEYGVICYTQKKFEKIEKNEIIHISCSPLESKPENIHITDLAKHNQFTVHSFLYEHKVLKDIGNYNESLPVQGDWEFNLRFIIKFDIGVIPEFLVNYHIREEKEEKNVYANTVLKQHRRYQTAIRNQFIRNEKKYHNLSTLIANAKNTTELTHMFYHAKTQQKKISTEKEDLSISVNTLRDVALFFEKKNDIKTALSIMKQAQIKNPDGPFIKKCIEKYKTLLKKN